MGRAHPNGRGRIQVRLARPPGGRPYPVGHPSEGRRPKDRGRQFYPIYRLLLGGMWSRGRCLLLRDAAHAMSPHVGQGVSMALEDVFLLSRLLLEAAASSSSLPATSDKFDKIRRSRSSLEWLLGEVN